MKLRGIIQSRCANISMAKGKQSIDRSLAGIHYNSNKNVLNFHLITLSRPVQRAETLNITQTGERNQALINYQTTCKQHDL